MTKKKKIYDSTYLNSKQLKLTTPFEAEETKINQNILARARPHLFNAGIYLKPYSWINVRKLAKNVNVSPTIAGCVLTILGWKKDNPNGGSSSRTYRR